MARVARRTVTESREQLLEWIAGASDESERSRVSFLLLISSEPGLTFPEVAERLSVSVPTVKRWWRTYLADGFEGLVGRPLRAPLGQDSEIGSLVSLIARGTIRSKADVRAWLNGMGDEGSDPGSADGGNGADPEAPLESLLVKLDEMPEAADLVAWIKRLREALLHVLHGIDRISIRLNTRFAEGGHAEGNPELSVVTSHGRSTRAVRVVDLEQEPNETARFLASLRAQNFPLDEYHEPYVCVFRKRDVYLGTVAYWRDIARKPLDATTKQTISRLNPLVAHLLSEAVSRYRVVRPLHSAFVDALEELSRKASLTRQEQRVVIQLLMGADQSEVADSLNISRDTVRYHLRSIYRKTGAQSVADLFAKYFTPRLAPTD